MCNGLYRFQKHFHTFVTGPYRVFHARATEIECFPPEVLEWVTKQTQGRGELTVSHGEAFCHPCLSVWKSKTAGDVMVKRY